MAHVMQQARRPAMRASLLLVVIAVGCKTMGPATEPSSAVPSSANVDDEDSLARQLLCRDVGDDLCRLACPDSRSTHEFTECLIAFRFSVDPIAQQLARDLYGQTNALVGIGLHRSIDGFPGEEVQLFPALPIGTDRHHLEWLSSSLKSFDAFADALAPHAKEPLAFERRPRAFAFYRTAEPAFPSAYCSDGVIAYNLDGPLHTVERGVLETLFHELFHINDARRGAWSEATLGTVFEDIIERCGDEHECFRKFAPHSTVVSGGTFYGFDRRTRDVREYAAELALRYFVEHETILGGTPPAEAPFKCRAQENRLAWELLARDFFGGVDLTPRCNGG
jgi:hypothetical protein